MKKVSLDEYIRYNKKHLLEGLDDLQNGRSKTYDAWDYKSLEADLQAELNIEAYND